MLEGGTAFTTSQMSVSEMADLFGEPPLPAGFGYLADVISGGQEVRLRRRLEQLPLAPFEHDGYLGKRRICAFGHRYLFAGQKRRVDASIPDYLDHLREIAARISGRSADAFEQVMVTEYAAGAGIGWHRDGPTFGEIVAVSFGAACQLRLRRRVGEGWERRSVLIEPRSAYLLQGTVRNVWQHSIVPMDALRFSVTLRTFRPGHQAPRFLATASNRDYPPD